MPLHRRRFPLLSPMLGAALIGGAACKADQNLAAPAPLPAQTANANANAVANESDAAFNARMEKLEASGNYTAMVSDASARSAGDVSDASAQYALARGSFYNGDFALAITAMERAILTPLYAQDPDSQEILRVARFLNGKFAGQKFEPIQPAKGDVQLQSEKWRARGAALMAAKKYDEIEKIAAQQAKTPTIMSDGGWVLAAFYAGIWDGATDPKTDAQWRVLHARVAAWSAARPNSQLARTCLARSWTNGAWLARGSEYADKVSPEAWKIVEERQKKAAPIYGKLLSEKVNSPLVYAAAQRFGRLSGAPREWQDAVFTRAIAKFPAYTDFHRERATQLLPRWDGAPGEWEAELEKSADVEARRAGTEAGDRLYARVVWEQWGYYRNMKKETEIDWPRTQRGFDAILRQNPNSLSAATIYMRLCYQWGESTKARQLLQKIGGRADGKHWRTPNNFARTRISILRLLP